MPKSVVIETKNIEKRFQLGKVIIEVLKGINLKVYSSEFVIIFGPSGSGKSTLIDLIAGLELPDSGDILVRKKDITSFNADELAYYRNDQIGLVFQEFNLIPNMTALENVALPLVFSNEVKSKREKLAKKRLTELGLDNRLNHKPYELSGGEQQRVALARALINNPGILLVDEPTGDLDTKNAEEIMQIFIKLNKYSKRTILMVTHNREYMHYAERVLELRDGIIINERK